jgi:AraC-like DNA-binding protein
LATLRTQADANLPDRIERPETGIVVQRLTTEGLAARDQYPYWKEAVSDIFVGLDCSRSARGPFRSAVLRRSFELGTGSVHFIDVASEAQRAERSPRQLRRATEDWIMLALQTNGPGMLRQGGEIALLKPGDMVLYDTTRPYEFVFDRPMQQLVVKFPHAQMAPRLPSGGRWHGRALAASSPLGHVLATHLASVSATIDRVEPALRPSLIERTMDLIALAFTGAARDFAGAGTTVQAASVARAKRIIEARLADPALSPGIVAEALGVSPGYLHRLFHTAGTTVGAYVRQRRLERCRDDLADPLRAGERITEIALRWGFNDPAHFSRAFHAAFGQSPRDWRASSLGGAGRVE